MSPRKAQDTSSIAQLQNYPFFYKSRRSHKKTSVPPEPPLISQPQTATAPWHHGSSHAAQRHHSRRGTPLPYPADPSQPFHHRKSPSSHSLLTSHIHKHPSLLNTIFSPTTHLMLTTLLILSLILKLNCFLTDLFLNNFDFDFSSGFEHGKEIVVVTGGASGIGEAIVRELSASVESVQVLDIQAPKIPSRKLIKPRFFPFPSSPLPSPKPPPLYQYPKTLPANNTTFHHCDITSTLALSSAAKKIRELHGEPTIVINNAALTYSRPILSETAEQIERVINVNLISHFLAVKWFLPSMVLANRGHVVTIASMGRFVILL
jgi:hypothetical protein